MVFMGSFLNYKNENFLISICKFNFRLMYTFSPFLYREIMCIVLTIGREIILITLTLYTFMYIVYIMHTYSQISTINYGSIAYCISLDSNEKIVHEVKQIYSWKH